MAGRLGFVDYVKAAFKSKWNLLFLGAGVVAALISGRADVVLPILAAGEIGYLGLLGTNPRYRLLVDARHGDEQSAATAQAVQERFRCLYRGLDQQSAAQFEELRRRCLVLTSLANNDPSVGVGVGELARSHIESVNKLLWVYLKLLYTKGSVESFLMRVDFREIDRLEREARQLFALLPAGPDCDHMAVKKRKSIEDTLATVEARRENIRKARENHEYVWLEIQRIEAKLTGLAELAANRQDPGMLTNDIDTVARSVEATEDAIGELQSLTGFAATDDMMAPDILSGSRGV